MISTTEFIWKVGVKHTREKTCMDLFPYNDPLLVLLYAFEIHCGVEMKEGLISLVKLYKNLRSSSTTSIFPAF